MTSYQNIFNHSLEIGSYALNIDKTKLDAYFKVLEDNNRFMGSVAIAKDGKSLYTKAIWHIYLP